jgi:hypothetical protein
MWSPKFSVPISSPPFLILIASLYFKSSLLGVLPYLFSGSWNIQDISIFYGYLYLRFPKVLDVEQNFLPLN